MHRKCEELLLLANEMQGFFFYVMNLMNIPKVESSKMVVNCLKVEKVI